MLQRERGVDTASARGDAPIAYLPWVQPREAPEPVSERRASLTEPDVTAMASNLLEELQSEADETERADAIVLRKLARRGLSQREVELELGRELEVEQVVSAVQRYIRLGYIDDDRLAEDIVRLQRERKGQGLAGVRHELERRGIAAAVCARVLADCADDDELARATELAIDRLRRLAAEQPAVQQRRLIGYLMRRGYSAGLASKAVRAAQQPQ